MWRILVMLIATGVLVSSALGQSLESDPKAANPEPPGREPKLESGYGRAHFPITCKYRRTQLYFDQGLAMLHGFAPRAAERSFQMVLTLEPDSPMSWFGMALANLDQPQLARFFLKQAIIWQDSAAPREQSWIAALERSLIDPQQPDEELGIRLVTAWRELSQKAPDDIEARAFLIQFSLEAHLRDPRATLPVDIDHELQTVLESHPRHAMHAYALVQNRGKHSDQAIAAIEKACQVLPHNPHVWTRAGRTFVELGLPSRAVPLLENALRQHHREMSRDGLVPDQTPGYAETCDWFIKSLAMSGRFDAARNFCRHMLSFPSTRVWNWDNQYRAPESLCVRGAQQAMWLLTELEHWEDLAKLAEAMDFLGPDAECGRQLAWGRAAFALNDHAVLDQRTQALIQHRQDCEVQSQRLETDSRLKRNLRDPAQAASDWSRRLQQIDSALSELRLYAALARKDFPAVRAELPNTRLPDGWGPRISIALGEQPAIAQALQRALKSASHDALSAVRCRGLLQQLKDHERLTQLDSHWQEIQKANAELLPDEVLWRPDLAPAWTLSDRGSELHSLDDYRGKPLLVVLYLGAGCPHCIEQLQALSPLKDDFERAGLSVVTVSTDSIEGLHSTFQVVGAQKALPYRVLSDESKTTFRAYGAWNESQSTPLHGVFLIDGQRRMLWSEVGKEPFMATRFLLTECERLLKLQGFRSSTTAPSK